MTLISKEDAIETVCDKCPISYKEKCEWRNNGHCSTKVALETLPPAETEWIPCGERLPRKNEEVLVTVNGEFETFVDTDSWAGESFWTYMDKITAWMPLPKPYREESEVEE